MKNLTYPTYSLEEYLVLEEQSDHRNEYRNGQIDAMAGESQNHSLLCANCMGILYTHFLDKDCKVFTPNMKVYIPKKNKMYYPDVSVVCGEVEASLNRNDMIANPVLLFEVLSKSTAKFDQGEKFEDYKTLKSFKEYVLIDQYQYRVEVCYKEKNGWSSILYTSPEDTLYLRSLNVEITLASLYQKVTL